MIAFFCLAHYDFQARISMARRKRELLDLLRERDSQNDASRAREAGKRTESKPAEPQPAPSQSKKASKPVKQRSEGVSANAPASFAERFAEIPRPVLGIAVLLLVVLGVKFWPGDATSASTGPEDDDPSAAAVTDQPFAVLVMRIPLSEESAKTEARTIGLMLRDSFPELPEPVLALFPRGDAEFVQVWLGEAPTESELEPLLRRVQQLELPGSVQAQVSFNDARIAKRPQLSS